VVWFTPRSLYPRYTPYRWLGAPQSLPGRRGEEKILDDAGTRIPTRPSSSPKPVAIPTRPDISDGSNETSVLGVRGLNLSW
jgi:hypothetical protein